MCENQNLLYAYNVLYNINIIYHSQIKVSETDFSIPDTLL